MPFPIDMVFDAVGPTERGNLATTSPHYVRALYNEMVTDTVSTSAVVLDMAKFADGTARVGWLRDGTFVTLKPSGTIYIRQRNETSTVTSTANMRKVDPSTLANGELDLIVDSELRYLEVLADASGTLKHWKSNRPGGNLQLSDT